MIETCRLKNAAILSFVMSRKIINIYNDIAQKYENVTVKDFPKYENLAYKKNKLKLDIDFFNNCKQLDLYPKFLIFKLPNISNKNASITLRYDFISFHYNIPCITPFSFIYCFDYLYANH